MRLANKISLLLITIPISCFLAKQQSYLWDIRTAIMLCYWVLCFATEIHAKEQPITRQATEMKEEVVVKSLERDKRFLSNEWLVWPIIDCTSIQHFFLTAHKIVLCHLLIAIQVPWIRFKKLELLILGLSQGGARMAPPFTQLLKSETWRSFLTHYFQNIKTITFLIITFPETMVQVPSPGHCINLTFPSSIPTLSTIQYSQSS